MSTERLCGCHGCTVEKPKLEARIAELEALLAAAVQPFSAAFGCLHLRAPLAADAIGMRHCPDCGQSFGSFSFNSGAWCA